MIGAQETKVMGRELRHCLLSLPPPGGLPGLRQLKVQPSLTPPFPPLLLVRNFIFALTKYVSHLPAPLAWELLGDMQGPWLTWSPTVPVSSSTSSVPESFYNYSS